MVRIPTHRQPTHPGEMLLEEFLNPMGLTQRELADAIHVPYQRVNDIVNGRRSVTLVFDPPADLALEDALSVLEAEILPELVRRGVKPDLVTDQTSAHDPING